MNRTNINTIVNRDEFIFLPGHPEADSQGFISINNPSLISEMTNYIIEAKKAFHEMELRNKRKLRIAKF
jgi:flagellar basal body rod protein FlgC